MMTPSTHLDSANLADGGHLTGVATTPSPHALLSGYELIERIGAGGYGEVWKALAPGGLLKAVKVVYARMDDARGHRELRALERMKQVRHPFLLSLERFEVVDGLLVIVTELADGSLKDRFEACRAASLPGIPRQELLGYMRDAAEALDYLGNVQGLQHLDVKPENLLLVSGRLKVADFGLVKGLADIEKSMMGGLTPLYAPPEVFDGNAHGRSDQYSLAIVFYQMLTGALPYAGRTAAQLAAQHLYSRPMLAMLPAADQPLIARAMSKDPENRFGSCCELVDALNRGWPEKTPGGGVASDSTTAAHPLTGTVSPTLTRTMAVSSHGVRPRGESEDEPAITEFRLLSPLAIDGEQIVASTMRPAVFVGIGSLGAKVLRGVRRRICDRFETRDVPGVQFLLLDTSVRTLNEATGGENETALAPEEILYMPLRASGEYRENARDLTGWINRRWLFNIPRSQQTEGLRPLGRLALIDHAAATMESLRKAIRGARSAEAVSTAGQALAGSPRVFIVASTSGGAGSGMVLDVAHLARKFLRDEGLNDSDVCVVMAHGTDRRAANRDLALANTAACLLELRHLNRAGGQYPGEPALRLMPVTGEEAMLANTYFVHLGDDLSDEQLHAAADRIADYLDRSSATPAARFFDQARATIASEDGILPAAGVVRSFGIAPVGFSTSDIPTWAIDQLCGIFIDAWRGTTAIDPPLPEQEDDFVAASAGRSAAMSKLQSQVHQAAAELANRLDFDFERIIERVDGVARTAGTAVAPLNSQQTPTIAPELREPLVKKLEEPLGILAVRLAAEIRDWVLNQLSGADARLHAAQWGASWFVEHLSVIRKRMSSSLGWLRDQEQQHEAALSALSAEASRDARRAASKAQELDAARLQLDAIRWQHVVFGAAARFIGSLHAAAASMFSELVDLGRDLEFARKPFTSSLPDAHAALSSLTVSVLKQLREQWPAMIAFMEMQVDDEIMPPGASMRRLLKLNSKQQTQLVSVLRRAARQVLMQSQRAVSTTLNHAIHESAGAITAAKQAFSDLPLDAGAGWLLVCAPAPATADECCRELAQASQISPSVAIDPQSDAVMCYEVGEIPLRGVLESIIGERGELLDAATKLHTRIDVAWCGM